MPYQRAFLDESVAPGRVYIVAAVVITASGEPQLGRELEGADLGHFHAVKATRARRRAMERFIAGHTAQATVAVVPLVLRGSQEEARQQCLATLAVMLRDEYGVTDLVMDSREDLNLPPEQAGSGPMRATGPPSRNSMTATANDAP